MSITEKIRLFYPFPIAKLFEAMWLEVDPRHRVRRLIDLFEGITQYLALIGLASYIHHKVSDPYVEKLRPGLEKPSLGHWVNLLTTIAQSIRPHDPTFLNADPKRTYKDDAILEASRKLSEVLEMPAQFQKTELAKFLRILVEFRNKKFGHGSLYTFEAEQVNEPLEAALVQWLEELSILQQRHMVSIARVESKYPHFVYIGTNLNSGAAFSLFKLNSDKTIIENRVYLYNPANTDFIPLYPFFVFNNDTYLLYVYSELSNQRKPILKCPYEITGVKIIQLDLDPSIILGNTQSEAITAPTTQEKSTSISQKTFQPEDASLAETGMVPNHNQENVAPIEKVDHLDQEKRLPTPEIPSVPASSSNIRQKSPTTTNVAAPLANLEKALRQAPVMGQFHPLVSLCLPNEVETIDDPDLLLEELDALAPHSERPVLITRLEGKFAHRFTIMNYPTCPPAEVINQNLPYRINEARKRLLTSRTVAAKIEADARQQKYQTVVLLLVDGLSYVDVLDWPEHPEPCFIDGPSITFSRTSAGHINPEVGFPAIIGTPSLARRLIDTGLPHSRGFSYWEREQNDVSEILFQGVPLKKVNGLADSFDEIKKLDLNGLYIQMVREGLDGLAHSRREVSLQEIRATVGAIHQDFRYLVEILTKKKTYGAIYLVADHGLLWKNQHQWQVIENSGSQHPRYATSQPSTSEVTIESSTEQQKFYLWQYPYLGKQIKANDSGVHGGLSYWESIVPFIRVEVNR